VRNEASHFSELPFCRSDLCEFVFWMEGENVLSSMRREQRG